MKTNHSFPPIESYDIIARYSSVPYEVLAASRNISNISIKVEEEVPTLAVIQYRSGYCMGVEVIPLKGKKGLSPHDFIFLNNDDDEYY